MQVINITSLSGTSPYDIYVCDETITYCFLIASSTDTVPQQIDLPSFLSGANSIILKVIDSIGCEEFQYIPCLAPTPSNTVTPTITPTVTPTHTNWFYPCDCIEYNNFGSGSDIGYQYFNCNGVLVVDVAADGDIFTVCGFNPSSDNIKLTYTILGECSSGSCGRGPIAITPSPTGTDSRTSVSLLLAGSYAAGSVMSSYSLSSDKIIEDGVTIFFKNELPMDDGTSIIIDSDVTIFPGQTTGFTEVSIDGDFNLLTRDSIINDVTYKNSNSGIKLSYSATSFFATPTNTVTSSVTPTKTPTNSVTPSITPTITLTNTRTPTPTPTQTPSITMSPSITPSYSVTPSITPTISITPSITRTPKVTKTQTPSPTVTPSVTSVPRSAYLFIEPISGASSIGNWMYNVNGLNFFGFSNSTQPTQNQTDFNIQLNTYVDYSGWTTGLFPSIITQDVPQTSGGVDYFGNSITAYNFKTTYVSPTVTGSRAWYIWIIPVGATNNLKQTQIDFSLSNPNVMTTLTMESTIYNYTFTYTGNTIPKTTYRVYTTYPSGDFAFDANTAIYFKGNSIS